MQYVCQDFEWVSMKEKQLEICPKYNNQLEKVSLILSNSNPLRSFKANERDHKKLNCT